MIDLKDVVVIRDQVVVGYMNFGERTTDAGIVLASDDGKSHGVRARWARVLAVGPEQKDVVPGDWVLIQHGRWTHGFDVLDGDTKTSARMVDAACMLAVSDAPTEELVADSV